MKLIYRKRKPKTSTPCTWEGLEESRRVYASKKLLEGTENLADAPRSIELTRNQRAIFDACDFDYLNQWNWVSDGEYAKKNIRINGNNKSLFMHRIILGTPEDKFTDHINGDGFDNRMSNLRVCTKKENAFNRINHWGKSCDFKGVQKRFGNYMARIVINRKLICMGTYKTALEAAVVYDKKAKEVFGEFAALNFPPSPSSYISKDKENKTDGM